MQDRLKNMANKLIILLMIIATMLSMLTFPVYADEEYIGESGGSSSGSSGQGHDWVTDKQGYRITIVGKDGSVVADPVDLVFSTTGLSGAEGYYNSKVESLGSRTSGKTYTVSEIMSSGSFNGTIPKAILWVNGGPKANGDQLKSWMTAENHRNIKALLNHQFNGQYVFQFSGEDNSVASGASRAMLLAQNSYKVLIEPIVWYSPFTKGMTAKYPNQVYGTITNHAQWSHYMKDYGFDDGGLAEYVSVMRKVGPWCLHINEDINFTSSTISAVSGSGSVSVDELGDNSKGYSLHVYQATIDDGSTKTWDDINFPTGNRGNAPTPPEVPEGTLKYRIVKVYEIEEMDSLGNVVINHVETFERYPTVSKISVNDEPQFKLIEWLYGTPYTPVSSSTEWGDAIKNVIPAKSGTSPELVDISDGDKEITLYVRLRKPPAEGTTHTWDDNTYPTGEPGAAPNPISDPSTPIVPSNQLHYRIVKTYEEEIKDTNGNITIKHVTTVTRYPTLPRIEIEDEPLYKLIEWKYGNPYQTVNSGTKWTDSPIANVAAVKSGTAPTTVNITNTSNINKEVTLYIRLRKPAVAVTTGDTGEVTITESQISKAIQTGDKSVSGWLPQTMTFTASSLAGTCGYTWTCGDEDCSGHTCGVSYSMKDSSYHYYAHNTEPIDPEIQANVGVFSPVMEGDVSGSRNLSAHTRDVSSFNYKFVIWRAQDVPTIANYKENSSNPVVSLVGRYGKTPQGSRFGNSTGDSYTAKIKISLNMNSSLGDYYTESGHHDERLGANHINDKALPYTADVIVKVYWGNQKEIGNATLKGNQGLQSYLIGKPTPKNSSGQMIQANNSVAWYPYIRMTYQTTGTIPDSNRTNVSVLSQFISELVPNDYVESAWSSNTEYNMNIRSSQWSVHTRATSGDSGWNYSGGVLPGGAIYSLDTKDTKTWASVISWQFYLEEDIRNNVVTKGTEYSYEATKAPHEELAEQAKKALEAWRVVQYVKDNHTATTKDGLEYWKTEDIRNTSNPTYALDGVAITGGNESLGSLGLTLKSSTEDKYYLKPDGTGTGANEGDIDIISENLIEVRYKVSSDVSGNIYVWRYRVGESTNWEKIDTLKKNEGADKLSNAAAVELDAKTKIVTNLCTALTRNTGADDSAAWVADNHWYNEAVDSLCIVRYESQFELGFKNPNQRTNALDPRLSPANSGQRDLFTKAFVSQFAMNSKSDAYPNEIEGFIGKFKGTDVVLAGYKELFKTRLFSLPNVSVQDLN